MCLVSGWATRVSTMQGLGAEVLCTMCPKYHAKTMWGVGYTFRSYLEDFFLEVTWRSPTLLKKRLEECAMPTKRTSLSDMSAS